MVDRKRRLMLRPGPGAPEGNRNALRTGLWSEQPPVAVTVPPDAGVGEMVAYVEGVGGASLWIAETLHTLDVEDEAELVSFEVQALQGELDQLVALYAAVAGEAADLAGMLRWRPGITAAPLGELKPDQYDYLRRTSARALSLLLSRAASAKERLERDGLAVAGKLDNTPELNPVLRYLASIFRKALRQAGRHAQYAVWAQRAASGDGMEADPARILMMGGEDDDE